MRDCRNGPEMG